jgi:hypothetical protein
MTYADDIESDLSRFHRLDLWSVSFARVMRLAGRLPAYGGALAQAMSTETAQPVAATAPVSEVAPSTGYPQAVDGDTPPEVVERMRQEALVRQFQARGVDVTGFREVSSDEMERLIRG